jgi:ABC-type multidrug transport system fused ATPase/permease subunit
VSLTVEGLRFGFGDDEVLRGVDFHVEAGEVVALVGSTGVGKTTICNLVARLVTPTGGSIALNGHPIEAIVADDLRDRVAIVFQESFLFADTIRENVTMGRLVPPERLAAALDIAQATPVIDGLDAGLDQVVGERGVTLSGGQRQRVALARALVRQPQVLVLDDATSAIDPTVEARILAGLGTELAATTLIVAHRLATIRLADRVIYLDEGRIAAAGTHEELLAHAGYEALVRAYEDGSA